MKRIARGNQWLGEAIVLTGSAEIPGKGAAVGPARHWSAEEIDFVSTLGATVSLALDESNRARSEIVAAPNSDPKRDLYYQFSTPPRFYTTKTLRRHSCIAANYPSFDHFVGAREQFKRYSEPQRICGFEIDHQFGSSALLDGEVSRLCARSTVQT